MLQLNHFRRKKKNSFRLEKETKAIKDRILKDIKNLFDHEDYYYKPVIVNNFWSNNYIEYKSEGDRKTYQLKNIWIKLHNA